MKKKIVRTIATALLSFGIVAGSFSSAHAHEAPFNEPTKEKEGINPYSWVLVERLNDQTRCALRASELYRQRDGFYVKDYKCVVGNLYAYLYGGTPR